MKWVYRAIYASTVRVEMKSALKKQYILRIWIVVSDSCQPTHNTHGVKKNTKRVQVTLIYFIETHYLFCTVIQLKIVYSFITSSLKGLIFHWS